MKHAALLAITLAVALTAAWAFAQAEEAAPPPGAPGVQGPPPQSPPDSKGAKRQGQHAGKEMNQSKAREMLEQVMIARLSSELKLNDEQSVLLMRRFTEAREEKQSLGRERAEAMRALRGIVDQNKDEAALNECLARLRDTDAKLASHRQRLQETMGADLSPWQRGKLVLFLDQFEADIKQMLRQAQERRNARPMGGPPMPGMQPRPGMPPGPGMNPPGLGRDPMQPGPNGPAGMRPPQGHPQGPPPGPPQGGHPQGPPQGPPPPQAPAN